MPNSTPTRPSAAIGVSPMPEAVATSGENPHAAKNEAWKRFLDRPHRHPTDFNSTLVRFAFNAGYDARRAATIEQAKHVLDAHDDPSLEIVGDDGFPLIGSVERAEWVINELRTIIGED